MARTVASMRSSRQPGGQPPGDRAIDLRLGPPPLRATRSAKKASSAGATADHRDRDRTGGRENSRTTVSTPAPETSI
jgi:hypothetical protein